MTKKKKSKKRKLKPFRLIIFLTVLFILIAASASAALLVVSIKDLPPFDEKNLVPSTSSQIFDSNEKLITKIGIENRTRISINSVPDHVKDAFLAAEDHLFYDHHGIRVKAIVRAAINDALHIIGVERNFQGASTITQQLVKLSFLSPERSIKRKVQEVFLSFQMERRYSKDEILGMYLNRIYFGEGAYGIQAAAQKYFGRDAANLTVDQAALLAGLIKSPNNYSPYQNPEVAISLRNQVLDNMYRYNFINSPAHMEAKSAELNLRQSGPDNSEYPYPYFMDYITDQLVEKFGEEKVFNGGLKVYTTLDTKIQTYAQNAMAKPENFPASKKDDGGSLQPQGAIVVMDPSSGHIKALVGGREHTNKRALNRATMSPRQPGSAIKPLLAYGPAVELLGMGPASIIDDAPVTYPKYSNYSPHNYDRSYRGLIPMRTALTHSVNVVAVKLLMDYVTIPEAVNFAARMNINVEPTGPAIALGGLRHGVTVLDLTSAYAAFDNHGIYNDPISILRVEDQDGTILYNEDPVSRRVMKDTTAYLVTDMLKSVVRSGTGTGAQIGRPQAGKTGTTDEGKDIWFAGFTPDLVGVVWIGYDTPTKMPQSYGGIYPARIWQEVMKQAHEDIPVRDFKQPPGIVKATVDNKSGLLPGPNTPQEHLITDLFAAGTKPTERDNIHVLTEICATTGLLPSPYCTDRITQVMLKLPYTVPSSVADFDQRVPTKICDMHGPDNLVTPEGDVETTPPWLFTPDEPVNADKEPQHDNSNKNKDND